MAVVEAEHRQHAVVELAIRDLKDQALEHFPSGEFNANAAWTVIACPAHNLLHWTTLIGLPGQTVRAARTLRCRLLQIPGRLTRSARHRTLHLPARWPWQHDFIRALARIRALPAAPDGTRSPDDHSATFAGNPADRRCPNSPSKRHISPLSRPPHPLTRRPTAHESPDRADLPGPPIKRADRWIEAKATASDAIALSRRHRRHRPGHPG